MTEPPTLEIEAGVFIPTAPLPRLDPMLRIQGYKDLDRVRPRVKRVAAEMVELAHSLFEPQAALTKCVVESLSGEQLRVAPGVEFHCRAFARYLQPCPELVVFVLTIGERFDDALDALQREERMLEALFLDTAGWLGIEAISKQFASALRAEAIRRGQKITRRLSPGYSFKIEDTVVEWPLLEQQQLFSLFDGATLPVRLLESSAMLPRMSRSGLYGLAPRQNSR